MSVQTVQLFYALLCVLALIIVAGVLVMRAVGLVVPGVRAAFGSMSASIRPNALAVAALVALLATFGSLFFSEVAHYDPCKLCWFQRIAMYPLAVVLSIAAVRREWAVAPYVVVLATVGAVISGYHTALEWIPALDTGACGLGPSCTVVWFRELGFVSLPVLALSAFLLIVTLLTLPSTDGDADRRLVG